MKKINRFLFTTFILFIFYLAYTSSFARQEVITGLVLSLIISLFTYEMFARKGFTVHFFTSLFYIIIYIPVFLRAMIKANIDVARRVINPSLPINPGIVEIKTDLSGERGKMFLANSITLTPGTLTLDIREDTLYIHWIDVQSNSSDEQRDIISAKFERLLGRIF